MNHWIRLLTGGNLQPDGFLEAHQLSNRLICTCRAHHFLEKVPMNDVRHVAVVVVVVVVVYRPDRAINVVLIRCLVQHCSSTLVAFRAGFKIHRLHGGLMRAGVYFALLIGRHGGIQCGCEARGRCAVAGRQAKNARTVTSE